MTKTARTWQTFTASNGAREITVHATCRAHAALTGRALLSGPGGTLPTIDGTDVQATEVDRYLATREAHWTARETRGTENPTTAGRLYVG